MLGFGDLVFGIDSPQAKHQILNTKYQSLFQLCYYVAEKGVVGGNAGVEVGDDASFGDDGEAVVVFAALVNLGTERLQLVALLGGER